MMASLCLVLTTDLFSAVLTKYSSILTKRQSHLVSSFCYPNINLACCSALRVTSFTKSRHLLCQRTNTRCCSIPIYVIDIVGHKKATPSNHLLSEKTYADPCDSPPLGINLSLSWSCSTATNDLIGCVTSKWRRGKQFGAFIFHP